MPAKKSRPNSSRNGHLEEAIAILVNNQAQFLGVAARIESDLADIKRILHHHEEILLRHEQVLSGLTEAIREKIGFKPRA